LKIGISNKIITGTALTVIIPLVLTGLFEYFYFLDILKENSIAEEKNSILQTEQQFSFIQDDVKTYTHSLIHDEIVQKIIYSEEFNSIANNTTDKYDFLESISEQYDVYDHLIDLASLRDYLHSIIILTEDDYIFSSIESFNHPYLSKIMKEDWYTSFVESGEDFNYSEPHFIDITGVERDVVSYITKIKDTENTDVSVCTFIININYDYLENLFDIKSSNFESFICMTEDNNLIYNSEDTDIDTFNKIKNQDFTKNYSTSSNNGFYIACKSETSNWKYMSYSSFDLLYKRVENILYILIIIIIISFVLTLIINIPITHSITKPIKNLSKSMDIASKGNLNIQVDVTTKDEISNLCIGFNYMINQIRNSLKKKVEYEREKKCLEFDLLIAQINPHFIYNVLNAVIYMARKEKTKDIITIIESFINILQKSLVIESDSLLFTIEKEINFTKSYIQIQQFRYRDRFKLVWDIDKNLYNCLIPKTLLQPLVENAIYHGICPNTEKGLIKISIKDGFDIIMISVEDNGLGMDPKEIDLIKNKKNEDIIKDGRKHIGIINIRDRIKFLFGKNYGIDIVSEKNKGTKIFITLPKKISSKTAKK
jgi:two-component system sensor histidine kinase YesM